MAGNIFLDLCIIIIMMLIHENNVELQMATKVKVCDPCSWVFFIYMLLINYVVMKKARTGFQP